MSGPTVNRQDTAIVWDSQNINVGSEAWKRLQFVSVRRPRRIDGTSLLINCVDKRMVEACARFMSHQAGRYFQSTIAGASGGISQVPEWGSSLIAQARFMVEEGKVRHLYLVDHEDCALYMTLYGAKEYADHAEELHKYNLARARQLLQAALPADVGIRLFLIGLNGKYRELVLLGRDQFPQQDLGLTVESIIPEQQAIKPTIVRSERRKHKHRRHGADDSRKRS